MHEYVIDIPGTIRRWQRWRKTALLIAVTILLGYSGTLAIGPTLYGLGVQRVSPGRSPAEGLAAVCMMSV